MKNSGVMIFKILLQAFAIADQMILEPLPEQ